MQISIIIPTYNEAENIHQLVPYLLENANGSVAEIIIADGASTDNTLQVAEKERAIPFLSPEKGRAAQMNNAAAKATGDVLYFVHADSIPPKSYVDDIQQALDEGYKIGCYRFKFRSNRFMLKINSYFTRFDKLVCRGGDQTLFITKEFFNELNGYKHDYVIMEEYDLIQRARKKEKFKIIPKDVLVSARKYDENSYLRVNFANFVAFNMFRLGYAPMKILKTYKRLIRHPKADAV